jgi:hypothetical protein
VIDFIANPISAMVTFRLSVDGHDNVARAGEVASLARPSVVQRFEDQRREKLCIRWACRGCYCDRSLSSFTRRPRAGYGHCFKEGAPSGRASLANSIATTSDYGHGRAGKEHHHTPDAEPSRRSRQRDRGHHGLIARLQCIGVRDLHSRICRIHGYFRPTDCLISLAFYFPRAVVTYAQAMRGEPKWELFTNYVQVLSV